LSKAQKGNKEKRNRKRTRTSLRPMCRLTRRRKARASRPSTRSRERPEARFDCKVGCAVHRALVSPRLVLGAQPSLDVRNQRLAFLWRAPAKFSSSCAVRASHLAKVSSALASGIPRTPPTATRLARSPVSRRRGSKPIRGRTRADRERAASAAKLFPAPPPALLVFSRRGCKPVNRNGSTSPAARPRAPLSRRDLVQYCPPR
jgi:hypothetical protein